MKAYAGIRLNVNLLRSMTAIIRLVKYVNTEQSPGLFNLRAQKH